MNGLCRELMAELLAAGAATARNYEPEADERNAGNHGKRIVTLFGELPEIKRTYYWNEDSHSGHYPFDDRLGLVGRYTPAAADEMARCAVSHPYKDAAEAFSRCHAFKVSPDTIREIVGMLYDESSAFTKGSGGGERDACDEKAGIVCVMADGTGMPMRRECLKGAKGKDGRARTREVKAGAIFVASRTKDNEPHRDLDTTTYVATTHRREKFGKYLRSEFDRRFSREPDTVLYITDGGKWLHSIHESEFPFAVEILDVYHAVEHLKPLLAGLGIKENSKEWKYRHHYWSECIKAGKVQNVLDYIWKNMRARLGKDAMREYKYYRSNAGRMKYDEYRANGWFIGSGVIESGCKTVIGQRFKQSGMIWSLKGAKALLPLRTLYKSNRLEQFFAYLVRDLRQVDCAA
ncbi:MAG: ISKra4 family transposase [Fibrobacter sp.]|nr:ISKra4 family transposase [Fibrobacter sp.]